MHFARSVRMVEELSEQPSQSSLVKYHHRTYLETMERLVVQQVVTAFEDTAERKAILESAGLGHLVGDAEELERMWDVNASEKAD